MTIKKYFNTKTKRIVTVATLVVAVLLALLPLGMRTSIIGLLVAGYFATTQFIAGIVSFVIWQLVSRILPE